MKTINRIHLALSIIFFFTYANLNANATVIEEISAIFQEQIISKSEINRVLSNYNNRASISLMLYPPDKNNVKDVTNQLLRTLLIRDELKELNQFITEKEVDAQIAQTKKGMNNIDDERLDEYLKMQGLSLREYKEIIQATIEFQTFQQLYIRPSLSEPTEQQIKNRFFEQNAGNNTLSLKYTLVRYSIPKSSISPQSAKLIPDQLKDYVITKILPSNLQGLEELHLGSANEDGLTKELRQLLKKTEEGAFSDVILLNGEYQSYFIEKKDLVESDLYLKEKNMIISLIYQEEMDKAINQWEERKKSKHYIRIST